MRPDGTYVIDAWVQPWTTEIVEASWVARAGIFGERYGVGNRVSRGVPTETLIQEMDDAGIDVALCSAGPIVPNRFVLEALKLAPDKFFGVATADPWGGEWGVMDAVRELRTMVTEHGFVGLKLEPFINDRVPTEAGWYPLYAACVDLDVTVQIQVGSTGPPMYPSETGRPCYIDRVAIDFPELRIVAGHIGVPWTDEMIAIAAKHPNVWIDSSAHQPKYFPPSFVHFARTYGKRKCIWASDWPVLDFDRALAGIDDLGLSDETRQMFLAGNAARAFKLPLPLPEM